MSYIIEKVNSKYLSKVKTTNDLIYKDKLFAGHNLNRQYIDHHQKNQASFLESFIKYGNQHYYYNNSLFYVVDMLLLNEKITFDNSKIFNEKKIVKDFYISEIQNSLWIEGVFSSKKTIKQIIKSNTYDYKGEKEGIYIKNYQAALNFIFSTNDINENNLFVLYNLLTKDIDMKENQLDGFPYRQGEVEIGSSKYQGIAADLIKESIDSIFQLIDKGKNDKNLHDVSHDKMHIFSLLNAMLIHYHFELVHPYYDMNGRTGRLFSLWYAKTQHALPSFAYFSEAINLFKTKYYYKAFEKSMTKKFKFDATYFVGSMFAMLIAHKTCLVILNDLSNFNKDQHKAKFSKLQQDFLVGLISKKVDQYYLAEEIILGYDEINKSLVSKAIQGLEGWGLIKTTKTKPKEYKLVWTKNIFDKIDQLLEISE